MEIGKVKKNYWDFSGLVLIAGLVTGALFANIWNVNVGEQGAFLNGFIEKIRNITFDEYELLMYILKERLKILIILFLISLTCFATVVRTIFIMLTGIFWGYMCSAMVMANGFSGTILFVVMCVISQGLFVVSVLTGMNFGGYIKKHRITGKTIRMLLMAIVLVLLAAILETKINVNFAKYYYMI